jgi:hypothetical protein
MERLWSLAGATSGNRWQIGRPRKRRNQAKTVATSCDQLPWDLDGKEGVDGSSPSEGFKKDLQIGLCVVCPDATPASRGYETGTFSDARTLADACDLSRAWSKPAIAEPKSENACKRPVDVGSSGAVVTTSVAKRGPACASLS